MTETERPLRADAARNRARVLEVAYETFAAEGLAVPIDEIARRAGVGAGTVYRHFPTKEALFEAVIEDRVRSIVDKAGTLLGSSEPGDGALRLPARSIGPGAADHGLADALAGYGIDINAAAPGAEAEFLDVLGDLLASSATGGHGSDRRRTSPR